MRASLQPAPERCASCGTLLVPMHEDDVTAYALPAVMCRCAVTAHVSALAEDGWCPLADAELPVIRKAKVRVRYDVAQYAPRSAQRGGSTVHFSRYVPTWARAVLDNLAMADTMKVVCLRRAASDPELASAAAAVRDLSGPDAMVNLLLRHLAGALHDPEDGGRV